MNASGVVHMDNHCDEDQEYYACNDDHDCSDSGGGGDDDDDEANFVGTRTIRGRREKDFSSLPRRRDDRRLKRERPFSVAQGTQHWAVSVEVMRPGSSTHTHEQSKTW